VLYSSETIFLLGVVGRAGLVRKRLGLYVVEVKIDEVKSK
jgi:hypothetical protein